MALRAIAELRDARRWTRKGRLHDSREQAGQAIVADAWCDVLQETTALPPPGCGRKHTQYNIEGH